MSDKQDATLIRDSDIPHKVRRNTGTKKNPNLKGKRVPRVCKSCIWFNTPMPGAPEDAPGNKIPCSKAYALDPEHGPITEEQSEWYACGHYVHLEHKRVVTEVDQMSVGQTRALAALTDPIIEALELLPAEAIRQAVDTILSKPAWQRSFMSEWAPEYIKERAEKAMYEGKPVTLHSEWVIKDEASGNEYGAAVLKSTKKWITLLIDKADRPKLGGLDQKSFAPDLFEQIATPLRTAEEEELEDEDE